MMNTDTAVLLLLADLQRDKAALQARVAELEAALEGLQDDPQSPPNQTTTKKERESRV